MFTVQWLSHASSAWEWHLPLSGTEFCGILISAEHRGSTSTHLTIKITTLETLNTEQWLVWDKFFPTEAYCLLEKFIFHEVNPRIRSNPRTHFCKALYSVNLTTWSSVATAISPPSTICIFHLYRRFGATPYIRATSDTSRLQASLIGRSFLNIVQAFMAWLWEILPYSTHQIQT